MPIPINGVAAPMVIDEPQLVLEKRSLTIRVVKEVFGEECEGLTAAKEMVWKHHFSLVLLRFIAHPAHFFTCISPAHIIQPASGCTLLE